MRNLWPTGWFARHPNWTVLLWPVIFFGASLVGGLLFPASGVGGGDLPTWVWVMTVMYFVGYIYLLAWNLVHKGRSLRHLLWLLTGLGVIIILFLVSKKGGADVPIQQKPQLISDIR